MSRSRLSDSATARDLHSFPTRRSSDLWEERLFPGMTVPGRSAYRCVLSSCLEQQFTTISLAHFRVSAVPICVLLENARSANEDRKSTRLNSSHITISYAVVCLKKKTIS